MKKLRVLVLSHMYPNAGDPTAGIFIHHQVRHLMGAGCEVVVVSPQPYVPKILAGRYRRYAEILKENMLDGIRVIYPRYVRPPGGMFHAPSCYSMFYSIRRLISGLVQDFQPHILHAHTASPDGYVGLLLRKEFSLPLVVSLRGSDVNVYPYRDRWTFYLTQKVISEADRLTAVSGALKAAAEEIAKPRSDIAVVYTGCDLDRFSFHEALRKEFRHRLGIPPESPMLIFIGHILQAKGIFELFDAFLIARQGHPDLHLVMIGSGDDLPVIKRKAEQVLGYMHFLGTRPHDEIPGWLSAADILVLPSWREGLPNVVVEAMACERSVVATRVGGIPEAVVNGECGILVEKQNVQELADAIIHLLDNDKDRERMGLRGREVVEERFSWEKNAVETLHVYREVLNGRH